MSDLREALAHITLLCSQSRSYTRRTQSINEVAMYALGMTGHQRKERHLEIMGRTGGDDAKQRYLDRRAKRSAQNEARMARREAEVAGAPP